MSPTVFREGGIRVFFFSREETRIHVHVQSAEAEAKFWMEPRIELQANYGFPEREIVESKRFWRCGRMKSDKLGVPTSRVEVANISRGGFWLFLDGRELFVSFKNFPWFESAPVAKILNVQWPQADHLYWPDLDVDLSVESIEHPERFPLVSVARA